MIYITPFTFRLMLRKSYSFFIILIRIYRCIIFCFSFLNSEIFIILIFINFSLSSVYSLLGTALAILNLINIVILNTMSIFQPCLMLILLILPNLILYLIYLFFIFLILFLFITSLFISFFYMFFASST